MSAVDPIIIDSDIANLTGVYKPGEPVALERFLQVVFHRAEVSSRNSTRAVALVEAFMARELAADEAERLRDEAYAKADAQRDAEQLVAVQQLGLDDAERDARVEALLQTISGGDTTAIRAAVVDAFQGVQFVAQPRPE